MSKDDTLRAELGDAVNLSADELEEWLGTRESQEVGQEDGGDGSTNATGRRVVEILRKPADALTQSDVDVVRTVVRDVHRQLAHRPDGDVTDSRWRYSLLNRGHDPLR